ncbi:MAG: hypothetical protein V3S69_03205 [Dehalococcoidales bacterium]
MKKTMIALAMVAMSANVAATPETNVDAKVLVQDVSTYMNMQVPLVLDSATTLASTVAVDSTLIYNYHLDLMTDDMVMIQAADLMDVFEKEIGAFVTAAYCTDPDLAIFQESGATVYHKYFSMQDYSFIFSKKVSVKDC